MEKRYGQEKNGTHAYFCKFEVVYFKVQESAGK